MSNIFNCMLLLSVLSLPVLAMEMENADDSAWKTIKLVSGENKKFHRKVLKKNILDTFGKDFAEYILSDDTRFLDLPDRVVEIIADILSCENINDVNDFDKTDKAAFCEVMHFFRHHQSSLEIGEYIPVALFKKHKEVITSAYFWNRFKFFIRAGKYKLLKEFL